MDDALELMPADVWRYYLAANAPESDDASFTWEGFAVAVNKDLADTLGNFVNRTLTLTQRHFGNSVPAAGEPGEAETALEASLQHEIAEYTRLMSEMELRKAMSCLRSIWSLGNGYLVRKAPWASVREDPDAAAVTLRTAINLIALYARLCAPVMPATAAQLLDSLTVPAERRDWPSRGILQTVEPGSAFDVPDVLFGKVSDEDLEAWKARFGGHAHAPS
jgi:methionyl-tRNA synthetase